MYVGDMVSKCAERSRLFNVCADGECERLFLALRRRERIIHCKYTLYLVYACECVCLCASYKYTYISRSLFMEGNETYANYTHTRIICCIVCGMLSSAYRESVL